MALRYWVGGSGYWNATSSWSTTSGGTAGASAPTSADDAIIDANSSTGALDIILIAGSPASAKSFNALNFSNLVTIKSSSSSYADLYLYGDLKAYRLNTYPARITMKGTGSLVVNEGSSSAGPTSPGVVIEATVDVAGDSAFYSLYVGNGGVLRTNGFSIDTFYLGFSQTYTSAKTIDLTNSTVYLKTWWAQSSYTNALVISTGSTIVISGTEFDGGGRDYVNLRVVTNYWPGSSTKIIGANTFARITLDAGTTTQFEAGQTQDVADLVSNGTLSNRAKLRSTTSGTRFNLAKPSGTVSVGALDIQDSNATGGATWNASTSLNSGNNVGWNFIGPTNATVYPGTFAATTTYGSPSLFPGNAIRQLGSRASTLTYGDLTVGMKVVAGAGATSTQSFGTTTIVQSPPPPPPPTDWSALSKEFEKHYVYRVYRGSTFLGIWTDVSDSPQFTQRINTPGTTMTVQLARSPNTTKEVRAALITQAGDTLTTQDDYGFDVTYQTNNSVGDGTDVDINLNVDVWVYYGEFSNLVTQANDLLTTEDGFELMVGTGAPSGRRIFSGYILDYELQYGQTNGVTATLASHGAELSQALVRSGEDIVVNYSSQELATTLKSVLDTNPGKMTYTLDSIANTGTSAAQKFMLNSKLEAIESLYDQSPDGFYWFGNVADNTVTFKQKSSTPDHTFLLGYHIKEMKLRRTQEQLRNLVYFVGAEVSGVSILKKYQDTTSQTDWRVGLYRITDRRYSVAANMQRRAEKEMQNYKGPIWTTEVVISAAKYDIETIELGQVVSFGNVEGAVRDLLLQIMSKSYKGGTEVTIQIGGYLATQADVIEDTSDSLANEQFQTIPNAPS